MRAVSPGSSPADPQTGPRPDLVAAISIVAVPVDDIDEALRFFCDVLGMDTGS